MARPLLFDCFLQRAECEGMMTGQSDAVLQRLMEVVLDRRASLPEGSYTTQLLQAGIGKIRKKLIEEAAELFEAAGSTAADAREQVIAESADLLYHLLVLLAASDVTLAEVAAELARREGISGLEEKAARGEGDS